MTPISYLQTDNRWGGNDYSAKGEKTTIARSGCAVSVSAMIIATLKDPDITPADTARWSLAHGYKAPNQGTYYSYFVPALAEYGIKAERINTSNIYGLRTSAAKNAHRKALDAIKAGKWVICCMGKGLWTSSGHYILWYGLASNGNALLRDSASIKSTRINNTVEKLQSEVKYYWIVDVEEPKTEGDDDEVVEDRKIVILGKEYTAKGIFKDGSNYISPKVFEKAGFDVTSHGAVPIINSGAIKLRVNGENRTVNGFNSDGTNFCVLRSLAEALGYKAEWEDGTVILTSK